MQSPNITTRPSWKRSLCTLSAGTALACVALAAGSLRAHARTSAHVGAQQGTLEEVVDEISRLGGLISTGFLYESGLPPTDPSEPMLRSRIVVLAREVLQRTRASVPVELRANDAHRLISQARRMRAAGEMLVASELLVPCWLVQEGRDALQGSTLVSLPAEDHVWQACVLWSRAAGLGVSSEAESIRQLRTWATENDRWGSSSEKEEAHFLLRDIQTASEVERAYGELTVSTRRAVVYILPWIWGYTDDTGMLSGEPGSNCITLNTAARLLLEKSVEQPALVAEVLHTCTAEQVYLSWFHHDPEGASSIFATKIIATRRFIGVDCRNRLEAFSNK